MNKLVFILTTLFMLNSAQAKSSPTVVYGEPLKLKNSQTVTETLEKAKSQEGQHIQITGVITDVCPMKGCWIKVTDPGTKQEIEVKVKDDVIVFPKHSKNKQVTVEGELVKKVYSKNKAIKHLRHRAKELGIPFDVKSVKGPMEFWTIKGKGAKIVYK